MPSTPDSRNGIHNGWDFDEPGWDGQMNANLLKLGALMGLSVIDRDLTAPPGTPNDGDAYIPATVASGAWSGRELQLAIWRNALTAWEFYDFTTTRSRILIFVEDENRLVIWNGTDYSLGVDFT